MVAGGFVHRNVYQECVVVGVSTEVCITSVCCGGCVTKGVYQECVVVGCVVCSGGCVH